MIEFLNILIDTYDFALLTAFLIWIMTSLSPCPLATNITAIAYISKDIKNPKISMIHWLYYTLWRAVSYTFIASLIYYWFSSFEVWRIFQWWGDKVLWFFLIFIWLVMLNVIKINIFKGSKKIEKIKLYLSNKWYIWTFFLWVLFALAFCPYSWVMYFGILIPLVLKSNSWLILPSIFALWTSIPVLFFVFILTFWTSKLSKYFNNIWKIEKYIRYIIAFIFIIVWIYYLQFTLQFLLNYY